MKYPATASNAINVPSRTTSNNAPDSSDDLDLADAFRVLAIMVYANNRFIYDQSADIRQISSMKV
jgi:hypothetical protein